MADFKKNTAMRLDAADMDRLASLARERRTSSSALVREFVARGLAEEERLVATARFERVLSLLLASNVPTDTIEP